MVILIITSSWWKWCCSIVKHGKNNVWRHITDKIVLNKSTSEQYSKISKKYLQKFCQKTGYISLNSMAKKLWLEDKLDQVHLACRTQFGDLYSIFLWMKRRSAKDKVFRPSKLWVYCPMIREIWVLGLWRKRWTEKDPSGWSFARGLFILLIIYKRSFYPDDHLQ